MVERLRELAREAIRARVTRATSRQPTEQCKRLLAQLRKNCPGLIPPDPLPAGEVGPEIPVDIKTAGALIRAALRPERGTTLLLQDRDNELLVEIGKIDLAFDDGVVVVSIPVRCDQIRAAVVKVPFALGSAKRRAGMIVATESSPRGPPIIIALWGEALTALAWEALLRVSATLAQESARDLDGAGLIPVALTATKNGLRVLTTARHAFDRVVPSSTRKRQP
jgi:hypothetical protein